MSGADDEESWVKELPWLVEASRHDKGSKPWFTATLTAFFLRHCPAQVKHVEKYVENHASHQQQFLEHLLTQYRVGPNDIMDEIAPGPKDIIIRKLKPSVFNGTALMGHINNLGADSLIVTGTTTSGCVRATVIDAFSLNLRVTSAEEGCFDRSQASHAINLCDMNAKYADVVAAQEVLEHIKGMDDDIEYNLPSGTPGA